MANPFFETAVDRFSDDFGRQANRPLAVTSSYYKWRAKNATSASLIYISLSSCFTLRCEGSSKTTSGHAVPVPPRAG